MFSGRQTLKRKICDGEHKFVIAVVVTVAFTVCRVGSRRRKRRSWKGFCSCRSLRSNVTTATTPWSSLKRKKDLLIYSALFNLFHFFFEKPLAVKLLQIFYWCFSHEGQAFQKIEQVAVRKIRRCLQQALQGRRRQ